MFLGIDLGTTYSVGAYIKPDGEAEVIFNSEGEKTTPSVVYIENKDSVVVGQVAKDMSSAYPKDVISLVKNSMGKSKKDGTPEQFETSHGIYSPEAISAFILKKIVSDANLYLNPDSPITDVVVTIPAYFDDAQRKATEDAIAIAGLNRLALINEPTAAAFYYANKSGIDNSKILIYDLGGGTFDVTIVSVCGGNVEVLSTGGLSKVGGSFFDKEIAQNVCGAVLEQCGIDVTLPEYSDIYQDILTKAEKSKIALSSSEKNVITVRVNSNVISVPITRDMIDEIVKSLYGRTEVVVSKALKEASLTVDDIDKVILVGGSSRIPFIAEHIEEFFGKKPSREVNPDEVVALGAALYGGQLSSETEVKRTIIDVNSHSIGITAIDVSTGEEYNDILIPKNTRLPVSIEKVYMFADDNVDSIYINVLEGERREKKYSSEICEANVKLPFKLKKGDRVNLRIEDDQYQILHIYLRVPSAGNMETEISFDRKSNLSDAQIGEWKKSTEKASRSIDEKNGLAKKFLGGLFGKSEEKTTASANKEKRPEVKKDKSKDIPKAVLTSMEGIVGMHEVKECLRDIKNRFDIAQKRSGFGSTEYESRCIAVLGKSGMGKTTAANRIAHALYRLGISQSENPVYATYDDIVKTDEQSTVQAIQTLFQSALGGTLIIDDFEEFYSDNESAAGMVTLKYLIKAYQKAEKKLIIIIAGEKDEMLKIFDKKPEFERMFSSYTIQLLGYTPDEYVTLFEKFANASGNMLEERAKDPLKAHFKRSCGNPDFDYLYSVMNLLDAAKTDVANKASVKRHVKETDYIVIRIENLGITEKARSIGELKEELNNLTGLHGAKEKINEIIKIQENTILKAKQEGREIRGGLGSMHMVFTGAPGTGKTTVARLVGEIYRELGVLKTGQFIEVTRMDLVSDIVGRTKDLVKKAVEDAIGGILFIDEAYSLYQDDNDSFGKEAVDTLVPLIENYRNDMLVIMAGYTKDMSEFIDKANTGLASRFNTFIEFDDYNIDEMMEIFQYNLNMDDYLLEGAAVDAVRKLILEKMKDPKFGNARGVRNIYEAIKRRQLVRLADMPDWGVNGEKIIRAEDVGVSVENEGETVEKLLAELNALTGLSGVKSQVNSMVNRVRVNQARAASGMEVPNIGTMHMIFAGSAGTGKTTVARLIGKIYKALGLLGTGNTIEVARNDLVAEYIGQTAIKTQSVINRSFGNVLFIDEAYTLVGKGENDYGQEAIDTLLKAMEDRRDSMVVILAGYSDKIQTFIDSNEGLSSRFKNWIEFEDYSLEEMYQIFEFMVEADHLILEPDAKPHVLRLISEKSQQKNFGNARGIRNLLDDIKVHMDNRLATKMSFETQMSKDDLSTIRVEDVF